MKRAITAIAALVLVGLLATFGPYSDVKRSLSPRAPLEECPASSVDEMKDLLTSIGEPGRAVYIRQIAWDAAIIAANATWLWIWLRAVSRRVLKERTSIVISCSLAAVPALADVAENLALFRIISGFPSFTGHDVTFARVASTTKFAGFLLTVAAALCLTVAAAIQTLRHRRSRRMSY
jgi:predicted signal transduction protein with EAL and GGDEF domain